MTDPRQRVRPQRPDPSLGMGDRERVLARRRLALIVLVALVPITLVLAIMTGSMMFLIINLVADVLIAIYVALLLQIKQTQGAPRSRPSGGGAPGEDVSRRPALMEFGSIRDLATESLDATYRARESGLVNCRRVIRLSANAIRSLHRAEAEAASDLMDEAGELLADTIDLLADHPQILHAGFVHDAAKEYAEARLTAALAGGSDLPTPESLGVGVPAYLNGLGEAVGELRRRMLDLLRGDDLEAAESTLATMDAVVELLASLDYPDGMTGGLRRTTDVARALVERSRSDLTTTIVQERLRRSLDQG